MYPEEGQGGVMEYKAIIFDMDGTIVDTEKIWAQANRILIERRGIIYTDDLRAELQPKIHGLATHKSCRIIKDIVGLEDPLDLLIQEKRAIAQSLYLDGVRFIEGFIDFHDHIEQHGLLHGIATNADDNTVHLTDKALDLKRFFGDHIYGISCVDFVCKPDPAIYLHAAEKLGVDPEYCIAIEDSAHGVAAAKQAGMYCIGINTAKSPEQLAKADVIFDAYQHIDVTKLRTVLE